MHPLFNALSRRGAIALIGGLVLAANAAPALAHHGWADYDADKRATLTGIVRELHFGNPHATMILETPDQVWNVMLDSPARLQNRGLTADMLAVGRSVTVEGLPHKSKPGEFRAERLILDGTVIELR